MDLGIYSFVETRPHDGRQPAGAAARRLRHLLEEVETAERAGLDVFGVGEHHRPDYVASSPATILAAAAARTQHIRLTSAVSVLSSDDPVRVFQDFATLDLLSGGRAEVVVGRGSFTESFPLFGQDLGDYDSLFAEKLDLLLALRQSERVTWHGRHRPPIDDRGVYPRPLQDPLPVWVAVGGTPQSVVRAGRLGLPLALAIIGGQPARFAPLVDLYRAAAASAGHDADALPVSLNVHGLIAETDAEAADLAFPPYQETMGRIGRERGWPPPTRARFDAERGPDGALLIGGPDTVAQKLAHWRALFGHDRTLVQFTVGPTPHEAVLRSIELFGTEVGPRLQPVAEAEPAP
jgi:probable LLM family oxidoreductase